MSNQAQSLGQWPNAPLALVLAQIRFDPEVGTEYPEVIQRIKGTMSNLFQATKSVRQLSFVMHGDATEGVQRPSEVKVGLELRSDDNRRSFRMQEGVATYTTSLYKDSKHFLAEWLSMLELLCPANGVKVQRLGLRYVDFIIPSGDKAPEDYFQDGFGRSPVVLGEQAPASYISYDYQAGNTGMMRIQYGRGYAPPSLPPDLEGSVLPSPSLTKKYSGGPSAVLDIDQWREMDTRMRAGEIAAEFQTLRDDICSAFKRIITTEAEMEWSGKPV